MAISKSQLKEIGNHKEQYYKEQYYIIIPFLDTDANAICKYFDNNDSKFRCSKGFVYYIISNDEIKDINKYIYTNPHVYKTKNKYVNKQEVFDDIKQEKIYIAGLNPASQIKGIYKVKI